MAVTILPTAFLLSGNRETASAFIKSAYRELKSDASESSGLDVARTDQAFQKAQEITNSRVSAALEQMAIRASESADIAELVRSIQDARNEADILANRRLTGKISLALARGLDDEFLSSTEQKMNDLDRYILNLERELFRKAPAQKLLSDLAPIDISMAQKALDPDEVLILITETAEFLSTKSEVFVWAITENHIRWNRISATPSELKRLVQSLRCGLDRSTWLGLATQCLELLQIDAAEAPLTGDELPFDHDKAHQLYLAIFSEIEDLVTGKDLIINATGALSQLPFQVLLTSPLNDSETDDTGKEPPSWLGLQNSITVLPSLASFKTLRDFGSEDNGTDRFLGLGNPLLQGRQFEVKRAAEALEKSECIWGQISESSNNATSVAQRGIRAPKPTLDGEALRAIVELSPLPETADEVCSVAEIFGQERSTIRLGSKLTETNLKEMSQEGELEKYGIVHFATHGTLAGEINGVSQPGLILTPPENPSDLDDGYLSAPEISSLRLNAEWVILSACNTAAGDAEDTEALAGMASAFFYAGSRTLMASHWYVDSQTSVDLVTATIKYYSEQGNRGKATAFRRAMAEIVNRGDYQSHPEFWAPFVLVGDGR